MLQSLSITNFALVDQMDIDFQSGFTTITGKTGSGKSVVLDALSWISGTKTDVERLRDSQKSCILEATFFIEPYNLKPFFEVEDLDWTPTITIRRTLSPNGKSRSFVQDIPVTQATLHSLTEQLLDIHSQEQNFRLSNTDFQRSVIDNLAHLSKDLSAYQALYQNYQTQKRELADLESQAQKKVEARDYCQYQYNELLQAELNPEEETSLETELKMLTNAQSIKSQLHEVQQTLYEGDYALIDGLGSCIKLLQKAEKDYPALKPLLERFESYHIDIAESSRELEQLADQVNLNPERLEEVNQRLNQLYSLQQKHRVTSTQALLDLQNKFEAELSSLDSYDETISSLKKQLSEWEKELEIKAQSISQTRKKTIPKLEKQILAHLGPLGMPHGQFEIRHECTEELKSHGKDTIQFYFTGNAQSALFPLEKVASGGEKARVMLAVKSILSAETSLPTILFDEIDIGVSGAIADRMGSLMQEMAQDRQVLTITHLPQVAAKGTHHYCVYKEERTGHTSSHLKILEGEDRIEEIAQMISGSTITGSAREQAKKLLG